MKLLHTVMGITILGLGSVLAAAMTELAAEPLPLSTTGFAVEALPVAPPGFAAGVLPAGATRFAAGTIPQQDELPPPPQQLAPHEAISQLGDEVHRLTEQRILTRGQDRSLTTKLDHVSDALRVGDLEGAVRQVAAFDREASALIAARVIGGKDALLLQGLTEQASAGLRAARDVPFVGPAFKPCLAPGVCEKRVLHVDQKARSGGNGSVDAPYRSIAEALVAADEAQVCGVEIVLHAGIYTESIRVTRATRIDGSPDRPIIIGSLHNPDGHELSVSRVVFEDSPAPGAIVADGPCGAVTEITGVTIRNAASHGVFQRGGALRIVGLDARGTMPDPADGNTGRAIRLVGGVQAAIGLANLSFNVGGGLLAGGEHTQVFLALSTIGHNDVHPLLASALSFAGIGIEVTDRALLLTEFTQLVGNRGTGILVANDARAHFRYGRIEHTRKFAVAGEGDVYGINAQALDGGTLELSHFRNSHAALVAFFLLRGYGRASHGLIGYNPIGVAGQQLPTDFPAGEMTACVAEDVAYLHNDRAIDTDFLPLPCGDEVLGPCPVCSVSVPFVCTWCG